MAAKPQAAETGALTSRVSGRCPGGRCRTGRAVDCGATVSAQSLRPGGGQPPALSDPGTAFRDFVAVSGRRLYRDRERPRPVAARGQVQITGRGRRQMPEAVAAVCPRTTSCRPRRTRCRPECRMLAEQPARAVCGRRPALDLRRHWRSPQHLGLGRASDRAAVEGSCPGAEAGLGRPVGRNVLPRSEACCAGPVVPGGSGPRRRLLSGTIIL